MNEQTKIELLKIAAQLTASQLGGERTEHENVVWVFERFAEYLLENHNRLTTTEN